MTVAPNRARLVTGTVPLRIDCDVVLDFCDTFGDLSMFVGSNFLITVHETFLPHLDALRDRNEDLRPDQVLYRLMNVVVDSYVPLIDKLEDRIEELQDQVVGRPRPAVLESIGDIRSTLMQLRRVLSNTRHVAFQLRQVASPLVSRDLFPFLG